MHRLTRHGEERLVLQSTRFMRVTAICLMVVSITIALGMWQQRPRPGPQLPKEVFATILFAIGFCMLLGPLRAVFDRDGGQLKLRNLFGVRRYPLEQIVGVQIIHAGWTDLPKRKQEALELNLILHNTFAPRVHLTNHSDEAVTRAMAAEIAEFLGVPVHDHVKEERRSRDD